MVLLPACVGCSGPEGNQPEDEVRQRAAMGQGGGWGRPHGAGPGFLGLSRTASCRVMQGGDASGLGVQEVSSRSPPGSPFGSSHPPRIRKDQKGPGGSESGSGDVAASLRSRPTGAPSCVSSWGLLVDRAAFPPRSGVPHRVAPGTP